MNKHYKHTTKSHGWNFQCNLILGMSLRAASEQWFLIRSKQSIRSERLMRVSFMTVRTEASIHGRVVVMRRTDVSVWIWHCFPPSWITGSQPGLCQYITGIKWNSFVFVFGGHGVHISLVDGANTNAIKKGRVQAQPSSSCWWRCRTLAAMKYTEKCFPETLSHW